MIASILQILKSLKKPKGRPFQELTYAERKIYADAFMARQAAKS